METPAWFLEANLRGGQHLRAAGAPIRSFNTGNVLMATSLFDDPSLWFDEALAGAGGEDADLSLRARQRGVRMVAAPAARTVEIFPLARVSLRWVLRRGLTVGAHEGRRRVRPSGWRGRLFCLVRGLVRVVVRSSRALVALPRSRGAAAWQINLAARGAGLFLAALGHLPRYVEDR